MWRILLALVGGIIGGLALYGAHVLIRQRLPGMSATPAGHGLDYKDIRLSGSCPKPDIARWATTTRTSIRIVSSVF